MAMSDRGRKQLSRRELLASGWVAVPVAAGILALYPAEAGAQQKMAQKLVQYQKTPKKDQKCSICLHFVAPDSCKMVEGKIDPNGWCTLYAPKPK
ncbi:MAG TPA: hypothetical protein VEL48_06210 [Candidatus Acidoferrales bacterium]|nr:hypothetical protein [Candidatus Acidoferrales bacterium]